MISSSIIRVAVIAVLAVAAAACSSKIKLREPIALKDIDHPSLRLTDDWSRSVGNGAKGRPTGLKLQLEADGLFAAELGGLVMALDPATGHQRWQADLKVPISAGPTVFNEMVLVGTLQGEVIALKRADGSLLWRVKVSSEVLAAPAGAGDIVVVRAIDGRAFGLAAADGKRLWSFDRTVPTLTLRGNSAPLIDGSRVLLGMDSGRLAAVQLQDGAPIWEQAISVPSGRTELERLADIDAQLLDTPEGVMVASYGGDVTLLDPVNGESHWRRAIKSDSGVAAGGSSVFVADADGVMWALDIATGAAIWKSEALQYRHLSPPAFFKGFVAVADYKGYVHFFDPADGKLVGRIRVGRQPILAPMVATDSHLYVMNVDGYLAALTSR